MGYKSQRASRYSAETSSLIRFNVMQAIEELAQFNGVDIETIKTSEPYCITLSSVTSQKIAQEIKKLVDSGMVVRSNKTSPMRYMAKERHERLVKDGYTLTEKYGFGDYRDSADFKVFSKVEDEPQDVFEAKVTARFEAVGRHYDQSDW